MLHYSFWITHSPVTHSKLSPINLVSIFIVRYSSSPRNPVYARRVDPSVSTFSLSLHRHTHICIPFSYRFIFIRNSLDHYQQPRWSGQYCCTLSPWSLRSRPAPLRPRCPKTLDVGSSTRPSRAARLRHKSAGHERTRPKGVLHPCVHNGTLSLPNRASGTAKVFSCFLAQSVLFRGCSSLRSREKCVLEPKSSGLVCVASCDAVLQCDSHIFDRENAALLTFWGGGCCRRPWSGLAVAGDPTALHNHSQRCMDSVWIPIDKKCTNTRNDH
jgi:hypothetical protein